MRRTSVFACGENLGGGAIHLPRALKYRRVKRPAGAKPKKEDMTPVVMSSFLVRLTGVEPVRPSGHKHLKLASLPIPAQPQTNDFENRSVIVHSEGEFVNGFFQNCCLSQCCSQILTDLNVLWVYSVLQQDLCNLIV